MITLGDVDKAATLREVALELLAKADGLDGHQPCTCGHSRRSHDPAGWNAGWCDGQDIARPGATEGECECEEFDAW